MTRANEKKAGQDRVFDVASNSAGFHSFRSNRICCFSLNYSSGHLIATP
jgi:hypothetical protein